MAKVIGPFSNPRLVLFTFGVFRMFRGLLHLARIPALRQKIPASVPPNADLLSRRSFPFSFLSSLFPIFFVTEKRPGTNPARAVVSQIFLKLGEMRGEAAQFRGVHPDPRLKEL